MAFVSRVARRAYSVLLLNPLTAGGAGPCLVPSHALSVLLGDGEGRLEAPSTVLARAPPAPPAPETLSALLDDFARCVCRGRMDGALAAASPHAPEVGPAALEAEVGLPEVPYWGPRGLGEGMGAPAGAGSELGGELHRDPVLAVKRTFQPSTIRKKRKHGFLSRNASTGGRRVLARRRAKGRSNLSV